MPINLHTFECNEWLVIGTADNALAEMVKAALFGHSHPSYRWPARSLHWAALTELHLSPRTGRPVLSPYRGPRPHAPYLSFPFPKEQLPQGTTGGHTRLFQKAKLQPLLGKVPRTL